MYRYASNDSTASRKTFSWRAPPKPRNSAAAHMGKVKTKMTSPHNLTSDKHPTNALQTSRKMKAPL